MNTSLKAVPSSVDDIESGAVKLKTPTRKNMSHKRVTRTR